ncbi:septal ring lytic transglycosylase RlpA family protein [Legionella maioricensis]|uniref:Endolytic peptidoglycan transglycosylase RlpA n=1 Tax=Legionella maioricensis TaxID=2896528 RepID=A0A9X2IDN7_9GAMM|nr:septal ring lytic transglycosylase RlpA family protein [Legionella maioricensis]MCL9684968.1 septal ring lytic transglycosylase RlpA family protein [Legionella maioricensis]MCL9688135.1 septal ring lytic transglycosylase RlpA family protein [Legionella maioricensis]
MRKILIIITVLISGCQTTNNNPPISTTGAKSPAHSKNSIYDRYRNKTHRYTIQQDGAPTKKKAITFKEPVPTKEPLSRYGNPTEYYVDGRTYEVLKSSTGYKTRGIASWYGTKFHKQRTSSGEPYDMYVMTAAHKTLPLPTYVKVKNLNNGRVAVVKVNDRGPFHADRVIDLSYAAALKLGVFPKGTAPVEIETLMGPAGQAHYYLQAGAFSSEVLARRLKEKLVHISPSPVFIEHYKQHYVVRVGPFGDKHMADNLKMKLAKNGVTGSFSVLI